MRFSFMTIVLLSFHGNFPKQVGSSISFEIEFGLKSLIRKVRSENLLRCQLEILKWIRKSGCPNLCEPINPQTDQAMITRSVWTLKFKF